ncbi:MAG: hypothetical protein WC602_04370 [archaeon]
MIEPIVAFTLFDKVLAGLGLIREGKKQRTEKIDHALLALYTALSETRAYIADREKGKRRNHQQEFEIARLWHSASIPLRAIDKEFAERCFNKGSYWMEPDTWDKKRIEEKGIAIDAVFDATRKLLIR